MRLVIDANEIFSFFNAKSKAGELALWFEVLLFSPYFAIDEIKKHELSVRKRFSLSERQFSLILRFLQIQKFFPVYRQLVRYIRIMEMEKIMLIILNGLNKKYPTLSSPDTARDYVHIDDVIKAYELAAQFNSGEIINIGTGEQTTISDVVTLAQDKFSKNDCM